MKNALVTLRKNEIIEYIKNLGYSRPDPLVYYLQIKVFSEFYYNSAETHYEELIKTYISQFSSEFSDDIILILNCVKVLIDINEIDKDDVFSILDKVSKIDSLYEQSKLLCFLIFVIKLAENVFSSRISFRSTYEFINSKKSYQDYENNTKSNYTLLLYQGLVKLLLEDVEECYLLEIFSDYISKEYIDYDFLEFLSFIYSKNLIPKSFQRVIYDILRYHAKNYIEIIIFGESNIDIDILFFLSTFYLSFQGIALNIPITNLGENTLYEKSFDLFAKYQLNHIDNRIITIFEELEISFNTNCLFSCMFLIRRIIEASLHIKALRENKIDEYKDTKGDIKDLKFIPDIAKDLGFISRYHAKDLNDMVEKTNNYIHNYRQPVPNDDFVRDYIEKLCEIIESLFN